MCARETLTARWPKSSPPARKLFGVISSKPMAELTRETLFTGRFLALVREGRWEYAHRVNATGAAIILAVTDDQRLLLVEQYRIPCHARTIELPAGIIGDE